MRHPFLDALRGFSICSMTLYHLLWDVVYLGGCSLPWYEGTVGYLWQQSICWVFIAVSGAALALEIKKKGRKRTAKSRLVLVGWGSAITFVTRQAMPHEPIYFGVLFFLGTASLLTLCLWPVMEKKPKGAAIFCSALFFFLRNAPRGRWGFEWIVGPALPAALTRFGLFSAFWGFTKGLLFVGLFSYGSLVGPFWGCFCRGSFVAQRRIHTEPFAKRHPFSAQIGQKVPMDLSAASAGHHRAVVGDGIDYVLTRRTNRSDSMRRRAFLAWKQILMSARKV